MNAHILPFPQPYRLRSRMPFAQALLTAWLCVRLFVVVLGWFFVSLLPR